MALPDFRKVDGRWQRRRQHGRWQWLHVHTVTEEFVQFHRTNGRPVMGERHMKVWTWEDTP